MRSIFLVLFLLAASPALAQVVTLTAPPVNPSSACTVVQKAAPEIRCDHTLYGSTTVPPQRIRWTIALKSSGQIKCLMWQQYQFIAGQNVRQAFDHTGPSCSLFTSEPIE